MSQGNDPASNPDLWEEVPCAGDQIDHIKKLKVGPGLNISNYSEGDCCSDDGWLEISSTSSRISGVDCEGGEIDKAPFTSLAFNTGQFCIETGLDCEAIVNWAGLSVAGGSGCCEFGEEGVVNNVSELRFGRRINLVGSGDGNCCEPSWVELESCLTEISGVSCGGDPIDFTGFTKLVLGSGLCLEYNDCVATISATGIASGSGCAAVTGFTTDDGSIFVEECSGINLIGCSGIQTRVNEGAIEICFTGETSG